MVELYQGEYSSDTQYKIYNIDKTIFGVIKSQDGNEPDLKSLEGRIFAYYPDYYIFHFKGRLLDNGFIEVLIGDKPKLLKNSSTIKISSIEKYILNYYCKATKLNPLRITPDDKARIIKFDYENVSFSCVEIKGDWVRVECLKQCEGCPEGKIIKGWIKWKNKNKIILKQFYSC